MIIKIEISSENSYGYSLVTALFYFMLNLIKDLNSQNLYHQFAEKLKSRLILEKLERMLVLKIK